MELTDSSPDTAVLEELGRRLARLRIGRSLTQAELADRSGVAKRTLERLEAGQSVQLTSLVRVFRQLGLVSSLGELLPEQGPGPMALLKESSPVRRRASRPKPGVPGPWTWGDEA